MEIKQYITKQAMNHWKTQRENQKYLQTNENEITIIQNL